MNAGNYAYNAYGSQGPGGGTQAQNNTLGLGVWGAIGIPVTESRVMVPSDMIAIGEMGTIRPHVLDLWPDGTRFTDWIAGFGYPGCPFPSAHTERRDNAVFCDGHVEFSKSASLPKISHSDGYWLTPFKPDAGLTKRWNNDNQPHPETWTN